MFQAMTTTPTPISRDYNKKIVKIIQALLVHEQSSIFRKPIPHKALAWEDYKEIVKRPIDLNFVRRQYNEGKCKSVEEALDEIQLIWDNVFMYGKREHETYDTAIKMQKYFDELLRDLMPQYYEKINRTAYFKQFQNKKPQKKTSSISNPEKNIKKVEKMQVENMKEEIKIQKQPQVIVQNKRRQPASIRRQLNSLQTNALLPVPLESTVTVKKAPQIQQNLAQRRKSVRNVEKIEQEEPVQKVQQNTLVKPEQSVKQISINDLKQKYKQKESQVSQAIKPLEAQSLVIQPSLPQPQSIQMVEPIEQESQDNHFPPIIVNLNKSPSFQEISEVTQMMQMLQELQEMDTLSKIVKILTKYEKQNMIIDGDEVNFRMNQIHISTYSRIRKEIQVKINQLELSDRVKDIDLLKERFNVKLMNGFDTKVVQNSLHNSSELQNQQN